MDNWSKYDSRQHILRMARDARIKYTVRRPISSDSKLDREGAIVSRHTSLGAAIQGEKI